MLFLFSTLYGQHLLDTLYNVRLIKDVTYKEDTNYKGDSVYLTLDAYIPVNSEKRNPTILFLHGGGFVLGAKESRVSSTICDRFAQLGYTAIAANYRKGYGNIDSKSIESRKTIYRVMEDISVLTSYIKSDVRLKVDTNLIVVGGSSAGAIASLHFALDDSTLLKESFAFANTDQLKLHNYKAIVGLCGALGHKDWGRSKLDIPLVTLHGDDDKFVPYFVGVPDPPKVMGLGKIPMDTLYGSGYIKTISDEIGREHYHYLFKNQPHIPYDGFVHPRIYKSYLDSSISFIKYNLYTIINNKSLPILYSNETDQVTYYLLKDGKIRINIPDQNINKTSCIAFDEKGKQIGKIKFQKNSVFFFSKKALPIGTKKLILSFQKESVELNL